MKGEQADCTIQRCANAGTICLLNNDHGFRQFCFKHAGEMNGVDGWRDASGELFRARERVRDELMMREFRR
jgi:hypothetical protein